MSLIGKSASALAVLPALAAPAARAAETANPSVAKEVETYLADAPPEADTTTFKAFWKDRQRTEPGH